MTTVVYFPAPDSAPCPPILTALEVAKLLRIESEDPERSVEYYRSQGKLHGFRVGRHIRYRLEEVMRFAQAQEANQ